MRRRKESQKMPRRGKAEARPESRGREFQGGYKPPPPRDLNICIPHAAPCTPAREFLIYEFRRREKNRVAASIARDRWDKSGRRQRVSESSRACGLRAVWKACL